MQGGPIDRILGSVMQSGDPYPTWTETDSPRVSERTAEERTVIPLVSREEAERVYSSQRLMSWEEKVRQIDRSLGRLTDSD